MSENAVHPLKLLRKDLDISQLDLAIATGLSSCTIKRAEHNESLNPDCITLICQYLSRELHREVTAEEAGLQRRRKNRLMVNPDEQPILEIELFEGTPPNVISFTAWRKAHAG